jgi:hypothetical protein
MSAGTGVTAGATPTRADGSPPREPADAAGRFLALATVLPALLVIAWLLAALPLLLLGAFTPVLMLVVSVPLAAAGVFAGLRWLPARWQDAAPAPRDSAARVPWWPVAALVAVALGFGVFQAIYHAHNIFVIIDPASYTQYGYWIAHHGSLPIPQDRAAFGGTAGALSFASPAFFQVGSTVVPQFMSGLPMVLAAGFWAGGTAGALLLAPVLGAGAVLTFGGLAARLIGPRWAVAAALALAVCWPELYTSRSTFSEPVAQILFLGGLCLVLDSLRMNGTAARVIAGLGGLALGITVLVRIDGISDILPVIPFAGLLLLTQRRQQALPMLGGLAAGVLYGLVDGVLLSRPYLHMQKASLVPLGAAAVLVLAVTGGAVLLWRRRGLPALPGWVAGAATAVPPLVLIVLTARPYLRPVRLAGLHGVRYHNALWHQWLQHSMQWVFWYLGVPAVVLAAVGAAVLARRCLRGEAPAWTLPLLTFGWAIVTVLYRPAIVPYQPWASRRLVPGVLPGLILLAAWGGAWLAGRVRSSGYNSLASGGLATVCGAALVVPAAMYTFGLGLRDSGPQGVRPVAGGLAFKSTEAGEPAAMNRLCAAIPHRSSVVFLDNQLSARMAQVVRGMCGYPTASLTSPQPATVARVVRGIEQAGRRPVLLAGAAGMLTPYGNGPREVMVLHTQVQASMGTAPHDTVPWPLYVWMLQPSR